jgi:class 3 adenylate cyclase
MGDDRRDTATGDGGRHRRGFVGYGYATEGSEERRPQRAFVHYLAPTLSDQLAEDSAERRLGGEERIITAMFADLTGFTTASTFMKPELADQQVIRFGKRMAFPSVLHSHIGMLCC